MRRLTLRLAALAIAAAPVVGAVAVAHTDVIAGAGSGTSSGAVHVLADDGVVSSRN